MSACLKLLDRYWMDAEHTIAIRTLDEHLSSDHSFGSALARTVGALAAAEGVVTLGQFAAVTDLPAKARRRRCSPRWC